MTRRRALDHLSDPVGRSILSHAPCIFGPPLAQPGCHAAVAGYEVGTVLTVAGLQRQVLPVVRLAARIALHLQPRNARIGQITPPTNGVGQTVQTIVIGLANTRSVRFRTGRERLEVLERERLCVLVALVVLQPHFALLMMVVNGAGSDLLRLARLKVHEDFRVRLEARPLGLHAGVLFGR
jgi:hypothetical protein